MLKILIVEDEPLLAATLRHLVELNPLYQVTGVAEDLQSAMEAAEERRPDLALVDLQLARGSTGYSVAVKLGDLGIPCLFTTSMPPAFPMPELALGCLSKPYSEDDLVRTLRTAEDIIRGRERWLQRNPATLQLYCDAPQPAVIKQVAAAFTPARSQVRSRRQGLWSAIR
jgi:DNA-binding NarL/FixJ family response regulator